MLLWIIKRLVWSKWSKGLKKKKKEKIIDKYNGKSDLLVWNCKGDQCNAIGYEQVSAQI